MPTIADDLNLAHRLADVAGTISLSYFRREIQQWSKGDGSLATEADLAVEDRVRALIAEARPADAMLGEERGETGSSARRWIVDAIDGTAGFAAGTPDWGTLIALEIDGDIVVGVCDAPVHGRRYWASKGQGAFRQCGTDAAPEALHVSATADLSAARSYLPPSRWLPDDRARAVADALADATKPSPHVDHPALQVAFGGYDLVAFLIAGPWDLAAPVIVVEEAGGRFTDLQGRHRIASGHAMFSNGRVHDEALRCVAHLMDDDRARG
jgi:histidinol-phosphatase